MPMGRFVQMKKIKNRHSPGDYVIVSNDDNFVKATKRKRKSGSSWSDSLLLEATKANRANRKYDFVKEAKSMKVIVRNKSTGRTISEFPVQAKSKSIRKFDLQAKVGTISRKKIFDAI